MSGTIFVWAIIGILKLLKATDIKCKSIKLLVLRALRTMCYSVPMNVLNISALTFGYSTVLAVAHFDADDIISQVGIATALISTVYTIGMLVFASISICRGSPKFKNMVD